MYVSQTLILLLRAGARSFWHLPRLNPAPWLFFCRRLYHRWETPQTPQLHKQKQATEQKDGGKKKRETAAGYWRVANHRMVA